MGWAQEMASEFRRRDNRREIGPQIGEVVSVTPLRIAMQSDAVVLEAEQIYLCSALAQDQQRKAKVTLDPVQATLQTIDERGSISGEGTITFLEVLTAGDLVVCIPVSVAPGRVQKFIVIDRVVQNVSTV